MSQAMHDVHSNLKIAVRRLLFIIHCRQCRHETATVNRASRLWWWDAKRLRWRSMIGKFALPPQLPSGKSLESRLSNLWLAAVNNWWIAFEANTFGPWDRKDWTTDWHIKPVPIERWKVAANRESIIKKVNKQSLLTESIDRVDSKIRPNKLNSLNLVFIQLYNSVNPICLLFALCQVQSGTLILLESLSERRSSLDGNRPQRATCRDDLASSNSKQNLV